MEKEEREEIGGRFLLKSRYEEKIVLLVARIKEA